MRERGLVRMTRRMTLGWAEFLDAFHEESKHRGPTWRITHNVSLASELMFRLSFWQALEKPKEIHEEKPKLCKADVDDEYDKSGNWRFRISAGVEWEYKRCLIFYGGCKQKRWCITLLYTWDLSIRESVQIQWNYLFLTNQNTVSHSQSGSVREDSRFPAAICNRSPEKLTHGAKGKRKFNVFSNGNWFYAPPGNEML